MEEKKIERELMSQEEFEKYINNGLMYLNLKTYGNLNIVRSVRRAIRRNRLTSEGMGIPRRPFNNRGNSSKRKGVHSRSMNELKKNIYEQFVQYRKRKLEG